MKDARNIKEAKQSELSMLNEKKCVVGVYARVST
jgi:hypothetical protein